jgi:hypothetical protein
LNPGPPAPQASVIIRTRLRAPTTRLYDKQIEEAIINTLVKLKVSGIQNGTLKQIDSNLRNLSERANLNNPEEVKTAIANYVSNRTEKPVQNSFKNNLTKSYNYFAVTNGIQWLCPHYRYERKVPLIPTPDAIDKIIAASSKKYATIFRLLA